MSSPNGFVKASNGLENDFVLTISALPDAILGSATGRPAQRNACPLRQSLTLEDISHA